MKLPRLSLAFAFALLASTQVGCGLLKPNAPDWASADVFAPAADGSTNTWAFSATGDTYLEYFYESVEDGVMLEAGKAENEAKGFHTGVAGVIESLKGLEADGATYRIVGKSDRFAVEIARPNDGVAEEAGRKVLDVFGAGDSKHAKLLETVLNTLPLTVTRLARHREELEHRMFGAVQDLETIDAGKELSFSLPDDVTPKQYAEMLHVLLAQLGRAREYIRGMEVASYGVVLAVRAAGSANAHSVANVETVLLASLLDARDYEQTRAELKDYPPPDAAKKAAIPDGKIMQALLAKTEGYKEFVNGFHAVRELEGFATDVNVAAKSFSAASDLVMGVDVYATVESSVASAEMMDFASALTKLAKVAPEGSELKAAFEKGAKISQKVQTAKAAAEAGDAQGFTLVLVEDEQEVKDVRAKLAQFNIQPAAEAQ